jgi:hypothetical protein
MNTTGLPQPNYSPDLPLADFFFISQTETHFERTTVSDDSRDCGKFSDGATGNPKKGLPILFPEVATALGAVCQCRRGLL